MPKDLFQKLQLDDSKRILIVNAPEPYISSLVGLHYDEVFDLDKAKSYDFVQLFAEQQVEMEALIVQIRLAGKHDCLFWACYPKQTGAIKSDMKRETVWHAMSLIDLQCVSQVAIDETWSALRGRPN
jgi:hypothetical protein